MKPKKTTIADIAREAEVGIGTVSRVLNNSASVSGKTRTKVLDVIKARQYTPSAVASKLARNDSVETSVGLLLPDLGNHYFFEIFETIYHTFRERGIDVILFNYEKDNSKVIQKILDAQVSALMVFAFGLNEVEKSLLKGWNIKYLYVDYIQQKEHCIYTDNYSGGILASSYLLEKGATKLCYISIVPPSKGNAERLSGFRDGLKKQGYLAAVGFYESVLAEEEGYAVGLQIIQDDKYDGVFCYCDEIAIGVIKAVREKGSSLKVIGFDGTRGARYVELSTISQGPTHIGTLAAETLLKLIKEGNESPLITHKIPPYLIDYNT
ncbi:MAG: LacI family transcriptional regulator [Spirochaetia bacterium]|nr:LacI family transcriptional regulator [Spirochaetia bacterium]